MIDEKKSSTCMLYDNWEESIESWHTQISKHEDHYIDSVKAMAERLKKNQLTYREFLEQVKTKQKEWERLLREEFVTATAGMQFLFPFQSLEKINEMFEKAAEWKDKIPAVDFPLYSNEEIGKLAVDGLEKNILQVRKNREQYLEALKKTASSIIEPQQKYLNSMQEQMKQLFFPFQSIIEKHKAN